MTALFNMYIGGQFPENMLTLDINENDDGLTAADVTALFQEVLK